MIPRPTCSQPVCPASHLHLNLTSSNWGDHSHIKDISDSDHIQTENIFPLLAKKVQVWRTYQDTYTGTVKQDHDISHPYIHQSVTNKHEAQDKCWYKRSFFERRVVQRTKTCTNHDQFRQTAQLHLHTVLSRIYNQTSTDVFHRFVFLLISLFWSTYTT